MGRGHGSRKEGRTVVEVAVAVVETADCMLIEDLTESLRKG